jgi:hypothetical protein
VVRAERNRRRSRKMRNVDRCFVSAGETLVTWLRLYWGTVISWVGVTGARVGCYGQGDGIECGENAGVGVMLCPH